MLNEPQSEPSSKSTGKASIIDLAGDLKDEFFHLFRATTQLLRIELAENVNNASDAIRRTIAGFVVAGASAIMLLLGVDLLIINLLAPDILSYITAATVSTLSLATILGIVGIVLFRKNKNALSAEKLIPDRTLATLEEHAEWISRKAEDLKDDTREL
ncbi:phage holin family protein [Pelagicoccus sp. SDUM812002]|uniref:phage holin family protein n=1 Tax=Pelagicoccus sp. SDUM812002 TaxID=3041266 RepID=UPI00280FF36A|nr:phage holin family protein [Pelagicoccus sp. SDUM812002]MDQ8187405.1 phage holin family protein [Pelagicoccus sp. SDUM812002]